MPSGIPSAGPRPRRGRRSLGPWRRSGSGHCMGRAVCFFGRLANRPYILVGDALSCRGAVAGTGSGEPDHGETTFGCELYGEGVGVAAGEVDLLDTGIHDHLHAHQARLVGAVDGGACDRDAVVGGLDDGVLFRVERTLAALAAVHYPDEASHVVAVGHA